MRKITTIIAAIAVTTALATPALAAYEFETGADTLGGFGRSTGYSGTVLPDPMTENTRRNKDAASLPPPYGVFGGVIDTDPASPLYDNLPSGGFVNGGQQLPPNGGEDYAPGINGVSVSQTQSTMPTTAVNTAPMYNDDGSIGTLYVERLKKTIKAFEGEDLSNLAKGAGDFSSTSAWDGNVAFASHNRNGYFGWLKNAELGDRITYTTQYGSRTYEVVSKTKIGEYDNSALGYSSENLLTLFTCVEDQRELRWCVVCREVKK